MKKISKLYSLFALTAALGLSSCIDEVNPLENKATAGQIKENKTALASSVYGISAQMCQGYLVYGTQEEETDMAYPQLMIAQTELLGDMYPGGSNTGYDWYLSYNALGSGDIGPNSTNAFLPWYTLYKFVKSANAIIGLVDINDKNTSDEAKGYAGVAYTCRAFDYFMLMSFYEPTENIYTDVSNVKGLTVPIITEQTTQAQAKNNPRATHEKMVEFILSDLDKAEACLSSFEPDSRMMPNLAVAYGVRAKVYMWNKDFANAAKYARMAIDAAEEQECTPMTESEWTDPATGFAKACSSWMWYTHYSPENMGNLCNLTGWLSNEAQWSYSSLSQPVIDRSLYDKIGETDFRKHVFVDPKRYEYYNYKTSIDKDYITKNLPDYASLKFRCLNGDYNNYSVGGAIDVPIMRIEEMYFIEALATAESADGGLNEGKKLLNTFMKTYRDPNFQSKASTLREFELELIDQMRIEFWGEGNAFPLAKQFKVGVMQNYEGVNDLQGDADGVLKINCKDIKPNWNFVIPTQEIQSNVALEGKNNPNPTDCVKYPSTPGIYAPAKK